MPLPDLVRRMAGSWSIIPTRADKRPALSSWKKFQERRAELFELEAWQRDLNPAAWAVVCGAVSGVICLDQDGEAGKETGARLGLKPHVETPSGGFHTYIRHPGHVVQTLNAKAKHELGARYPGLDIRADGGYALFCGHTEKGEYRWRREPTPDPLSAVPPDVREFLGLDKPVKPANGTKPTPPAPANDDIEFWTRQALARAASEGRNNAGVWLCRQLRDSAGLSAAEARVAMRNYATRCPQTDTKGNHDPYTFAEADATTASIYSRPRGEPARNPNRTTYPLRKAGGTPAAAQDTGGQSAAAGEIPPAAAHSESRVFPCTDLGNAERLRHRHGADIRYCHAWKSWLLWDGRAWQPDESGAIQRRAADTVRHIYAEASQISDPDIREAYAKFARKSESRNSLAAMVNLAESLEGVAITSEQLDRDPWLLNVENGTIDLRTGTLRRPRREDYITRTAPAEFVPAAECPTWRRFLSEVLCEHEDLIGFVERAAGYSLTGLVGEKVLFVCHGRGDNGKTTFLEVLKTVLGEYAGQVLIDTLMAARGSRNGPEPDIADLKGRRLVTSSEVEDGQRLAEGRVKYLTGMGTIKTRRLWEDVWEFQPTFKLWLDCNHLPQIRGTDQAIWERVKRIPFDYTVEPERRDRQLKEKLLAERAGILAWMVEGCQKWQASGLQAPEEVSAATQLYRAEMDILGRFLDDSTYHGPPTLATSTRKVYRAYTAWAESMGEYAVSERVFGQRMVERGIERRHERTGNVYLGIGLLIGEDEANTAPSSYPYSSTSVKSVNGCEPETVQSPLKNPHVENLTQNRETTIHSHHEGAKNGFRTGEDEAKISEDELVL